MSRRRAVGMFGILVETDPAGALAELDQLLDGDGRAHSTLKHQARWRCSGPSFTCQKVASAVRPWSLVPDDLARPGSEQHDVQGGSCPASSSGMATR